MVRADVPAKHQGLFCSDPLLVCMYLVNLIEGTLNICTLREPCIGEGYKNGVLFARRVNICEELYSGRMDFSSFTSRASKLDNIAGKVCHLVPEMA